MNCKDVKPFTPEEALRIVQNFDIYVPCLDGLCAIRDSELKKGEAHMPIRSRVLDIYLPAFAYGVAVGIRQERERRRAHA